jgi:hypothetical protein
MNLGKKTEFFEGEPIYAVLTLRNASADKVQITHFGLVEHWLQWSLRRSGGTHVPHLPDVHIDWACAARPGVYRLPTDPWPPGAARYRPVVLQTYWGEEGPLYHGSFYSGRSVGRPRSSTTTRRMAPRNTTPRATCRTRRGRGVPRGTISPTKRATQATPRACAPRRPVPACRAARGARRELPAPHQLGPWHTSSRARGAITRAG